MFWLQVGQNVKQIEIESTAAAVNCSVAGSSNSSSSSKCSSTSSSSISSSGTIMVHKGPTTALKGKR